MALNKVMLIGNVTKEIEIKSTPSGQSVASFSVATNEAYKDKEGNKQEKVEFHNIVAWGKLAEIIGQYVTKGMKIYIEGKLATRSWEADGVKKYRTEIVASDMQMLGSKPAGQSDSTGVQSKPANKVAEEEISIEDIPF